MSLFSIGCLVILSLIGYGCANFFSIMMVVLLKRNVSNWIKEILWCVSILAGRLDYWSKLIVFFASPGVYIEESSIAIFGNKIGI
jgi:hypothetical protein